MQRQAAEKLGEIGALLSGSSATDRPGLKDAVLEELLSAAFPGLGWRVGVLRGAGTADEPPDMRRQRELVAAADKGMTRAKADVLAAEYGCVEQGLRLLGVSYQSRRDVADALRASSAGRADLVAQRVGECWRLRHEYLHRGLAIHPEGGGESRNHPRERRRGLPCTPPRPDAKKVLPTRGSRAGSPCSQNTRAKREFSTVPFD